MKFKAGDRVLVLSYGEPGTIDSVEETRTYSTSQTLNAASVSSLGSITIFYIVTLDSKVPIPDLQNAYMINNIRTTEDDLAPFTEISELLYILD